MTTTSEPQKKRLTVTPRSWQDSLCLGDLIEACMQAQKVGMPLESEVRIEYDAQFMRDRLEIVHDPSKRSVRIVAQPLSPVEQAIESRGKRLVELGFVRRSDTREPIVIRLQIQDDSTNVVMTSIDLNEHQFAALLAGSVISAQDSI